MREHCTGIIGDVQILKAVLTGIRMIPCDVAVFAENLKIKLRKYRKFRLVRNTITVKQERRHGVSGTLSRRKEHCVTESGTVDNQNPLHVT